MAGRPLKDGIDYFKYDIIPGEQVGYFIRQFGCTGEGFLALITRTILGRGFYIKHTDDFKLDLIDRGKVSEPQCDEMLTVALKRGIFHVGLFEKYNILTSKDIQQAFFQVARRRQDNARYLQFKEYLLLTMEEIDELIKTINTKIDIANNNLINVNNNSIIANSNMPNMGVSVNNNSQTILYNTKQHKVKSSNSQFKNNINNSKQLAEAYDDCVKRLKQQIGDIPFELEISKNATQEIVDVAAQMFCEIVVQQKSKRFGNLKITAAVMQDIIKTMQPSVLPIYINAIRWNDTVPENRAYFIMGIIANKYPEAKKELEHMQNFEKKKGAAQ